jgi:hypothetical protein
MCGRLHALLDTAAWCHLVSPALGVSCHELSCRQLYCTAAVLLSQGWLNIDFASEVRLEKKLGEGGFGQVSKHGEKGLREALPGVSGWTPCVRCLCHK